MNKQLGEQLIDKDKQKKSIITDPLSFKSI